MWTSGCRAAAELLIKEYVRNGSTVATGSGKLAAVFTQCLAQSVHQGNLQGVSVLPASDAAAAEALLAGLPLAQLGEGSQVCAGSRALQAHLAQRSEAVAQADLLVYDVDCVDRSNWTCLAGRSPEGQHQPNLLRLQQVAVCSLPWSNECPSHLRGACCQIAGAAKAFVAVVERREQVWRCLWTASSVSCVLSCWRVQVVERLTGWLPVVIQSADWEPTAEEIDDMFLGVAEIWCASCCCASDMQCTSTRPTSTAGRRRSLLPEADPRGGEQLACRLYGTDGG